MRYVTLLSYVTWIKKVITFTYVFSKINIITSHSIAFTITSFDYHAASSFYNKQEYIISISGGKQILLPKLLYYYITTLFLYHSFMI